MSLRPLRLRLILETAALMAFSVACGPSSAEVVSTTEQPTTTVTAATAAATTTATTSTAARSVWCNSRDAGLWPRHEPVPYDPAPIDADRATIAQRLDRTTEQAIAETNVMFGNMAEIHADDPAILAEVEQARQSTIRQIQAQHRDALDELERRIARQHREARTVHDNREQQRAEQAALELSNDLTRYEIECQ